MNNQSTSHMAGIVFNSTGIIPAVSVLHQQFSSLFFPTCRVHQLSHFSLIHSAICHRSKNYSGAKEHAITEEFF